MSNLPHSDRSKQPPFSNKGGKIPFLTTPERETVLAAVGVDYLSLVAKPEDSEGEQLLVDQYLELARELTARGDLFRKNAIDAGGRYRGEQIGKHLFLGYGKEGAFLRGSSSVAQRLYMAMFGRSEQVSVRASRLDLQVTTRTGRAPERHEFIELADRSLEYAKTCGRRGLPWDAKCIYHPNKGDTAYIGSNHSEVQGYVYDKGREAPEEYVLGDVRYEIRNRREPARMLVRQLQKEADPVAYTHGYVDAWFEARGIELPIRGHAVELMTMPPHESDYEKYRKWFASSVAPGLRRWAERGYADDIKSMLGFLYEEE